MCGVRAVPAGPRLRAGGGARLSRSRVRARRHHTRLPPSVRGASHPGTDIPAPRRAVRGAGRHGARARLLRPVRGPVERRGCGAAAGGTRGEAEAGETRCVGHTGLVFACPVFVYHFPSVTANIAISPNPPAMVAAKIWRLRST